MVPFGCIDVEAFRPAQIDMYGNTNNIVIGDYKKPKVRLPGCGGICDATSIWDRIYFYIPDHNRQVFVEKLDFRSGLGFMEGQDDKQRKALGLLGKGPVKAFSNLGVMDFDEETRRMRLVSLHPGVTLEDIKSQTGFELIIPERVEETVPPSKQEIDLLNETIDPYGIRMLECLSGQKRNRLIRDVIEKERNARRAHHPAMRKTGPMAPVREESSLVSTVPGRRTHHGFQDTGRVPGVEQRITDFLWKEVEPLVPEMEEKDHIREKYSSRGSGRWVSFGSSSPRSMVDLASQPFSTFRCLPKYPR